MKKRTYIQRKVYKTHTGLYAIGEYKGNKFVKRVSKTYFFRQLADRVFKRMKNK